MNKTIADIDEAKGEIAEILMRMRQIPQDGNFDPEHAEVMGGEGPYHIGELLETVGIGILAREDGDPAQLADYIQCNVTGYYGHDTKEADLLREYIGLAEQIKEIAVKASNPSREN
ncbi:MAG: hypothetical protein ABII01_04910 [Candidatus Woesearchaeota archaeon]